MHELKYFSFKRQLHSHDYFRLVYKDGVNTVIDVVALPRNSSFDDVHLCDGNWHDVILRKTRDRATIEVDENFFGSVDITSPMQPNFNLKGPIFIGGVPENVTKNLFMILGEDVTSFGGCMMRIEFDDENVDFSNDVIYAVNVNLDGCPIGGQSQSLSNFNSIASSIESSSDEWSGEEEEELILFPPSLNHSNKSCLNNSIKTLYSGQQHAYWDTSVQLSPFSLFLYKVIKKDKKIERIISL